jgi:uncharacterized cupin superfamily protein
MDMFFDDDPAAARAALRRCIVLMSIGLVVAGAACAAEAPPWFRFSSAELRGDELDPVDDSSSTPNEVPTTPLVAQRSKATQIGNSLFLIYQLDKGSLNITGLPGDEFLQIQAGGAVFTDSAGASKRYRAGDILVWPRAWRGSVVIEGPYREQTVLPGSWGPALAGKPVDNAGVPMRPILRVAADRRIAAGCRGPSPDFGKAMAAASLCGKQIYQGDIRVELQEAPIACAYRVDGWKNERFVRVLSGSVTLISADKSASFSAGETFAVAAIFRGEFRFGKGYRGLLVTPRDAESPGE